MINIKKNMQRIPTNRKKKTIEKWAKDTNSNTVKKSEGLVNMGDAMSYPCDWNHVSGLTTVGNVGRDVEGGGPWRHCPFVEQFASIWHICDHPVTQQVQFQMYRREICTWAEETWETCHTIV